MGTTGGSSPRYPKAEEEKAMTEMTIREYIPGKSQEDVELLFSAFLAIWNEPENLRFLSFTQEPIDEPTVTAWF